MTITFQWRELVGMLPEERIVEALDDNRDTEADEDAWARILEAVSRRLTDIFPTAVSAAGASVDYAARVFACELLYGRRGFTGEQVNPWTAAANAAEKRLRAHATGLERPESGGGTAIVEDAQTYMSGGVRIA